MNDPTRSFADSTRAASDAENQSAAARSAAIAIPGYELGEPLGHGGMGDVFRARDVSLKRDVAVKILQEKHRDSPVAARFLEEARITGQLQHPGIPAVHQMGILADGRPYLAMKLIKGRDLQELLNAKEPIDTLAVFEAMCHAVGYAHAHGVIHRDLKPANVMVGAFGEVQVMDWGLAKVLTFSRDAEALRSGAREVETHIETDRDGGALTRAGSAMGTAAFMPPEQALGHHADLGPAADVFSLGATLCALLTGKPPYLGDSWESTHRLAAAGNQSDAITRLEASNAEPELVALCRRCLSPEPKDRPRDASVLAGEVAQLRRAADERAKQAEMEAHRAEVQRAADSKRRRVQRLLGSAIAAVLLLGIGTTAWKWRESEQSRDDLEIQKQKSDDNATAAMNQTKIAEANAKLAQRHLDISRLNQARLHFESNNGGVARTILNSIRTEEIKSSFAWKFANSECNASDDIRMASDFKGHTCEWSPDGQWFASLSDDNKIGIWNKRVELKFVLQGHKSYIRAIAWSKDSKYLSSGSDDGIICIWENTGRLVKEFGVAEDSVTCLAWHPNGHTLVSGSAGAMIRYWNVDGNILREMKQHETTVNCISWSPDGHRMASGDAINKVCLWDEQGSILRVLDQHKDVINCLAWSPDSKILASGADDLYVILWDDNGRMRQKMKKGIGVITCLSWRPDGSLLAAGCADRVLRLWNLDGVFVRELKGSSESMLCASWDQDGRGITATASNGDVRYWNIDSSNRPLNMNLGESIKCYSWQQKGNLFAIGLKRNGALRLLNTTNGTLAKLAFDAPGTTCVDINKNDAIACGCSNGYIHSYRLDGSSLFTIHASDTGIRAVSWNAQGTVLATADESQTIKLLKDTGVLLVTLKTKTCNDCILAWNPTRDILAFNGEDNSIHFWNYDNRDMNVAKGHESSITCMSWSPDGMYLATGSQNGTVFIWKANGALKTKYKQHTDTVRCIEWNQDSTTLATAGDDETIRIWDFTGRTIVAPTAHSAGIWCLTWDLEGKSIISGSIDRTIRIWDIVTGEQMACINGHVDSLCTLQWSLNGDLISLGVDGEIRVWEKHDSPRVAERRRKLDQPDPEHHHKHAADADADSQWFAAAFHWRRLAALKPANAEVKAKLAAAEAKLRREVAPLPRSGK